MKTTLRQIGNSRGVLLPATLLRQCGIRDEIDLRLEGHRIVIEPITEPRSGWFDHYDIDQDDAPEWPDEPWAEDTEGWEW
ncbi:AbrB/MazE/SpoVT family DNA-binding domain-containing protein [Thioalkalivibrio sp. AKL19]|uniref:AbrB/MazE/SpoVT family DNA-binding domain-containing protein n=1 Tax=Thioalkalivibrio sp. AKL19 TaxID=1266914 RepID=UPI0005B312D6|nr:AbrB/MazE/SpoVT family DNA-binding domain-containing protein [Thioalkalivibrio sp. AKL19]